MSFANVDPFRASEASIDAAQLQAAIDWANGVGSFPAPRSIQLDLTLRCTARCFHCDQWKWPRHAEMDQDQLDQLFDTFRSWQVGSVTLSGGNPLLHPHVLRALLLAGEAGFRIGILTERPSMSATVTKAIAEQVSWIRFSVDGPSASSHDRVRRSPGLFDSIVAGVRELREFNDGLRIGFNFVIQKENIALAPGMIDLAEDLGIDMLSFKLPHGDDPARRYLPTERQMRGFIRWAESMIAVDLAGNTNLCELLDFITKSSGVSDIARGNPVIRHYQDAQIRCFAPLFSIVCDCEGNAYPCCYLHADNRDWTAKQVEVRNENLLGNLLSSPDEVLERLAEEMRARIHSFPTRGRKECGYCTRHCQLNTHLSALARAPDQLELSSPRPRELGDAFY